MKKDNSGEIANPPGHHARMKSAMGSRERTGEVHRDSREAERGADLAKRRNAVGRDMVLRFLGKVLSEAEFYNGTDGTLMVRMGENLRNAKEGTFALPATMKALGIQLIEIKRNNTTVFEAKELIPLCRDFGLLDKMPEALSLLANKLEDTKNKKRPTPIQR